MLKPFSLVAPLLFFISLQYAPQAAAQASIAQAPAAAALTVAFESIYEKAEGPDGSAFNPVVVVPDDFNAFKQASAFGIPLVIKNRSTTRVEQLAWFLYVSELTSSTNAITMHYDKPYHAQSGTTTLKNETGQWLEADHHTMHSTSVARFVAGML